MIVYCPQCQASFSLVVVTDLEVKKITAECPRCGSSSDFTIRTVLVEFNWHEHAGGTEHKNDS